MKKIVIFGDSHTRCFSYIENVIPVFLDSGRTTNLSNEHIKEVKNKILHLKNKLPNDEYLFFTFLGEPNVRYQLDNDWYVHKNKNFKYNGDVNKEYLYNCIKNYLTLYEELNFISYVITPTTAYEPSIKSLIYFNKKLKQNFNERVIDIFSDTVKDNKIIESYKSPNFKYDPIHLNSNITKIFFKKLIDKNVIDDNELDNFKRSEDIIYPNDVKNIFEKNKFGTFNIKK